MKLELQKAMLVGMYLSKYDQQALEVLGFKNFTEAFNVIGLAINTKPASIRNYRDEFDPVFPNQRQGWRRRPMYRTRKEALDRYENLNLEEFTKLVKSIIYKNPEVELLKDKVEEKDTQRIFAKRLLTGQSAEQYFKDNYKSVNTFSNSYIEDTTQLGCGFDFKLNYGDSFFAVEVKGLEKDKGSIRLTKKEYKVATLMRYNYFIFLVKNFIETPDYKIFRDPVFSSELNFTKQEKIVRHTNWSAVI